VAPESVDEGRARRVVLERRDGVVVGHTGELGAVLGEASLKDRLGDRRGGE
jgi:hypothetical protein